MLEQTMITIAFTRGQPKLTKLWKKTCNRCPHRQHVMFHAVHAESTIPLNSENWVHELLIPQVQYYPPAPTNLKKHLKVASDEEKLFSLLCKWVLIDHGVRDRTFLPAHSLAKKSLKQLLTDPHEHSQTCFLYFRGRGIHWWRRFPCAVNESWRKIQVQTLHCSQQLLQTSQNNQTSTRKKLNTPRKQPHRSQLRAMKKKSKIRSFFGVHFSTFSQPLQVCIFSTIFEAAPRCPEIPIVRSASSVAIDITYCIGNVFWVVQKKLSEHLLKLWQG